MLQVKHRAAATAETADERHMIEKARDGDLSAFDSLIRRYEDQVFSVAFRLVGNEDDAADVAQEVFLACFRHLKSYRGDSKLSTWLHRITVNMVKNLWSRRKRQGSDVTASLEEGDDPDDPPPIEMIADPAPNPRRLAAGSEIAEVIESKLLEIEPEFREVIVLRFVEGLSYEEIADVTKEPLGTVKSRIFRARRALKDQMQDYLREF
jgi:RNA polymerase sigma-70 factor (ECF subfamily)